LALCSHRERARVAKVEARQGSPAPWKPLPASAHAVPPVPAPMVTLLIEGGRQDKLRAGDLLGAFTAELGLLGDVIGKIDVVASRCYVSIQRSQQAAVALALRKCQGKLKVKGKTFRVSRLTK